MGVDRGGVLGVVGSGLGPGIGGVDPRRTAGAAPAFDGVLPGEGPGIVTALFVSVILTDTAAYFGGRALGRHKLAPVVSPNKTWEGAVSGFVFAVLGMCVLYVLRDRYSWTALPEWSLFKYAIAGALLSVASQVGDLVESSLKRDAGVKDSGVFFPGHGGVLDRCDGFLFAAPVLYYIHTY